LKPDGQGEFIHSRIIQIHLMPPFAIPTHHQAHYSSRVEKALQYINEHLAEPLDLEILARASGFSPYHFHRIFSALLNESPQNYINRQRLEWAANLLVKSPSLSMTEVAMQCGFTSSSNFARSFKKHFGCTASEYAGRNRQGSQPYSWVSLEPAYNAGPSYALPEVAIKNMPALHLAYFSARRGYEPASVREVWLEMFLWAASRGITFQEQQLVAVSFDDPEITPPAKCRYRACLTIPSEMKTDTRASIWDIPAQMAAVCRLNCDANEIQPAYRALYRDWLPNSGFLLADLPSYEIYISAPDIDPGGKYIFDLCIPVLNQ
jgi:AraC family transcriptional regulator